MNTLRSTVKSRNRKQDAEKKGEDTSGDGGGDQGGSKMNGTTSLGSQNNVCPLSVILGHNYYKEKACVILMDGEDSCLICVLS